MLKTVEKTQGSVIVLLRLIKIKYEWIKKRNGILTEGWKSLLLFIFNF
jgi:hypothetical protein